MAVMKTPGVYIVEKNAFPNSVVEVATAVPAFIGYTEKADNKGKSLAGRPWRITSMAEYHSYFGFAPKARFTIAEKAATDPEALFESGGKQYVLKQADSRDGGRYLLYYAMLHFFLNGGGPCFVVSVGDYKKSIDAATLISGIEPLIKEQEPTMLVIPEAVLLADRNECTKVQEQMLAHCGGKMKNRVAILDIWHGERDRKDPNGDCIDDFRGSVGVNYLDFAAAYYPFVRTTIVEDRDLDHTNIANVDKLQALLKAELQLPDSVDDATPPKIRQQFDTVADVAKNAAAWRRQVKLEQATKENLELTAKKTDLEKQKAAVDVGTGTAEEKTAAKAKFDKPLADLTEKLAAAASTIAKADSTAIAKKKQDIDAGNQSADEKKAAKEKLDQEAAAFDAELDKDPALNTAAETRLALTKGSLREMSPVLFKTIMGEIRNQLNLLPPSAAMAGLYTMVDNSRGVWKAPANVSMNGVVAPAVSISAEEQEDLNVTTQGKSINAIRSFLGEGVLVWGARTLDGNSLDWRYINVRRTMIMLEESCRLAAKAMVFEPNVANTWVTIKSMVSNFLTGIWKRGGLAGAVPDDAFSVHCGLGETMTPEDILEGILRVTVLVAISRPAEFIEITFQQQMQKS